ncbi:hypothetical protein RQP46_007579 [Phenoliferia psychrophenolica]
MLAGQVRPPALAYGRVPSLPPPPLNPAFDGELLRPLIRRAFVRLAGSSWTKDAERSKEWAREIGEDVKRRMMEQEPIGYKYLVSCSIAERGQGGHGHLTTIWDGTQDVAVSETFTNDTLFCSVLAVAVRYN